jgi:hypothetical protein
MSLKSIKRDQAHETNPLSTAMELRTRKEAKPKLLTNEDEAPSKKKNKHPNDNNK